MDKDAFKQTYADELASAKAELEAMSRELRHLDVSGDVPGLLASRMGGSIAWPDDQPIPLDADGTPMIFALQIDFETAPGIAGFPRRGLLQLFLACDVQERGITFSSEHWQEGFYPLRNGEGFRLVFHADTRDLVETRYEIVSREYPLFSHDFAHTSRALSFGASMEQMPPMTHWRGSAIYGRFEALPDAQDALEDVYDVLQSEVWDAQRPTEVYLGGYACPLQLDQRGVFDRYQAHDRCVLNFGALPFSEMADMNHAILVSDADLRAGRFDDAIMIADAD